MLAHTAYTRVETCYKVQLPLLSIHHSEAQTNMLSGNAAAAIVAYSVVDRTSFEKLDDIIKLLASAKENCAIVLVGSFKRLPERLLLTYPGTKYDLVEEKGEPQVCDSSCTD